MSLLVIIIIIMILCSLYSQHTFSTLRHLTELDLHRNLLEKLPENFGQLSNLRRLDLHGNPLKTLPHAFWQLSRLEWLDLRENKFEKVDLKAATDVGRRCTEEKGHECAKKVSMLLSFLSISLSFILFLSITSSLNPFHSHLLCTRYLFC